MRFPDRSIVSAALGIALALGLLALLSSPVLLGSISNAPALDKATSQGSQSNPYYTVQSGTTVLSSSTKTDTIVTSEQSLTASVSSVTANYNYSTVVTTVAASSSSVSGSSNGTAFTTPYPPTVLSAATTVVESTLIGRPTAMFLVVAGDLGTLGVLTSASIVIAIGAMLFIKRRERSMDESD